MSRGPFDDVPLPARDLVFAPQLQFDRHIFLPICRRMVDLVLAPAVDPVPQGRNADPKIFCNRAPLPLAGLNQTDGLILVLLSCMARAALACRASGQITATPLARNPCTS